MKVPASECMQSGPQIYILNYHSVISLFYGVCISLGIHTAPGFLLIFFEIPFSTETFPPFVGIKNKAHWCIIYS